VRDLDPAQFLQAAGGPWWHIEGVKMKDPQEELGWQDGNRRDGTAMRTQGTCELPSNHVGHVYFLVGPPRGCVHHGWWNIAGSEKFRDKSNRTPQWNAFPNLSWGHIVEDMDEGI
jgi:hypothetical protein